MFDNAREEGAQATRKTFQRSDNFATDPTGTVLYASIKELMADNKAQLQMHFNFPRAGLQPVHCKQRGHSVYAGLKAHPPEAS